MKKIVFRFVAYVLLFMLGFLSYNVVYEITEKQQAAEMRQSLPAFSFQGLAGQAFELGDLAAGRPTLVIYFHPDCDHCQYEARAVRDSLHRFAEANVLLVSNEPIERLREFGEAYDLLGTPNVHILHDANGDFKRLFGTSSVPSIFIYNRNRELVKHYKGETKVEAILTYLE